MAHILAFVPTKGRYYTTLPLTLTAIALQTRVPDEIIIYDDGEHKDLRTIPVYQYIFKLFDEKKIQWSVLFGNGKGSHHGHQLSQEKAKELIWRIDDDCVPEPDVLEKLEKELTEKTGAVGGLILDPTNMQTGTATGKIENIKIEPNLQWLTNTQSIFTEHLYSSFLYRKGIASYDLRLSPAAHREESMFSHDIFKKGYELKINAHAITWHFRNPEGGIRQNTNKTMWEHDEEFFNTYLNIKDKPIVILDNGLGDHIVFRKLLDDLTIKDITISCCYPEVFEGYKCISIQDAKNLGYDLEKYNLYAWMSRNRWKGDLYEAFKTFYENSLTS